jgi:hypothetical protein
MGLHICEVVNRTSDRRGEYVHIANDGASPALLTGRELTDFTGTQQHVHVIVFPGANGGGSLYLKSGQSAYVFTTPGTNGVSRSGDYLLFAGSRASIWNDDGDVAYLREPNGQFIDSRTVGDPARHPNGH